MNLSFDVITREGDKVVVSLISFYPYISELVGDKFPQLEIVEITIVRESGMNPIKMAVFRKIAEILIDIAQDNPNTILYYFCDMSETLPNQRAGRDLTSQEYRNNLFKLLFQRYSSQAIEHWSDVEVEMRSKEPDLMLYAHSLLRDQHLPLAEFLKDEVLNNFNTILEQK